MSNLAIQPPARTNRFKRHISLGEKLVIDGSNVTSRLGPGNNQRDFPLKRSFRIKTLVAFVRVIAVEMRIRQISCRLLVHLTGRQGPPGQTRSERISSRICVLGSMTNNDKDKGATASEQLTSIAICRDRSHLIDRSDCDGRNWSRRAFVILIPCACVCAEAVDR